MIWKPKEKELTPEEAIALAKKELSPFWYGSGPLLAPIRHGEKVTIHPLDPEFAKQAWLIYLINPTDFDGQRAMVFAREYHRRYISNEVHSLLVINPHYSFFRDMNQVELFARKNQIPFPIAVDQDGLLCKGFNATSLPKVILLSKGKFLVEQSGPEWMKGTELQVQTFLRNTDPGLPLLSEYYPEEPTFRDISKIDFGRNFRPVFPAPGFNAPNAGGLSVAQFSLTRPKTLEEGKIHISGNWMQDGEKIATSDPNAQIGFRAPSQIVSIIAQALSKANEPSRLTVELGDIPVPDLFAGEDMTFEDDGQATIRLDSPRMLQMLANLPAKEREVTLKFHNANRVPIALYGLRFGATV